ncbi:MAG: antA/AntB antirepressor family protein [Candidatus Phlomobacter fragariae]
MSNLMNIETKNINGGLIQTVNARDLHVFLESKQDFSTWIKKRISEYGFVENKYQRPILLSGEVTART